MKRKCSRTFCGIRFTHVSPGLWKSDDGIELMKANILTNWDRWSVEFNPRIPDPDRWGQNHHGKCRTGFTAVEALKNSGLGSTPPKS